MIRQTLTLQWAQTLGSSCALLSALALPACEQAEASPKVRFLPGSPCVDDGCERPASKKGSVEIAAPSTSAAPMRRPMRTAATPIDGTAGAASAMNASASQGQRAAAQDSDAGPTVASESVATMPQAHGISRVSYSVMTESYGGRYEPENIGASWIQAADGTFVKSLEVWTRFRLRYLTSYAEARDGQKVDISTTATLSRHRVHEATWNLDDQSGSTVAPGRYLLWLEMSEDNGAGMFTYFTIDTTAPPANLTLQPVPGFGPLKVELQ